jgi:hypothetical protein
MLMERIREHIDASASEGNGDQANIEATLRELGDPADIVQEAMDGLPGQRGLLEIVTVAILFVGGSMIPLVPWAIGVALLQFSSVWNRRQRLLGALLVPGGPLLLLMAAVELGATSMAWIYPVAVVVQLVTDLYLLRVALDARSRQGHGAVAAAAGGEVG